MLRPFSRFCIMIGAIPESIIHSLSYEQQLLRLIKFLKQTVIPAIDGNTTAIQKIEEWIENVDLQEFVDTKLDEMVESGELQEIISEYLNSQAIFGYDTVSDMKSATNLINGSYAKTLGYHTKNDGGSATYKIRNVTNEDVVDESFIIAMEDETLVAELIIEYPINPLCLGAYGDSTHDDVTFIQKAINKGTTKLFSGNYYISRELVLKDHSVFDGNNRHLIPETGHYAFNIDTKNEISIRNVFIDTQVNEGSMGIKIKDSYFIYLDNINIFKLIGEDIYGINIENGFNIDIKDTRVYGTQEDGQIGVNLYATANVTNVKLDTLLLQKLDRGIKYNFVASSNTNVISNIGFSYCNKCIDISGYADPISMYDIRSEYSTVGIEVNNNVNSSIINMNCWNVDKPIVNKGNIGRSMSIFGALSFTGSTNTSKPIFETVTQNINVYGYIYAQSGEYNIIDGNTNYVNNAFVKIHNENLTEKTISGTSFTIDTESKKIYKISKTIDNIFGRKGAECYVYTDESNIGIRGSSGGSITCLIPNGITMGNKKLYHLIFLDGNKFTVID